jgi:hypothetical protein
MAAGGSGHEDSGLKDADADAAMRRGERCILTLAKLR